MKKNKVTTPILCALIICFICAAAMLPAGAADLTKKLDAVYKDIRVFIDGAELNPTDVNGNPAEPFIVDGTVYLPARAISEALGMDIAWDAETNSVYITEPVYTQPQPEPRDAPPAPSKSVTVSTPAEFLAAIAPDTAVTLKAGVYDLSTVADTGNPYVEWREDFYDYGEKTLVIKDIEGLTIQAAPDAEVEFVTPWRFAEVLAFDNCNGIKLTGITAGHSVTGDYECDAAVVAFDYTSNVRVEDSLFYGCGSIGMDFSGVYSAQILRTTITDCSLRAVDLWGSADITFTECKLINNRAFADVIMAYNSSATFTLCEISGNKSVEWCLVDCQGDVLFDGCVFKNNSSAPGQSVPMFLGGIISIKDCVIEKDGFSGYWSDGTAPADLGGNTLK